MPFLWNDNPNHPAPVPPIVIGPEETTYKVHVVANTVNAGGTVSYNTPNAGYDVIYELDSLNVRNMRVLTGNIERANIGTMIINTATINQATINTANITDATINLGYFTGNASANFSMVTKQYVDNAIAAISGGSGPDTTANLITTKGDLLVGFAPNTAHRFGVGSNGQVLSVQTSNPLKVQWKGTSSTQSAIGLRIGTHYHPTLKNSQVLLSEVTGIIMDDGEIVTGWEGEIADITVSGAGGRDTNSALAANTWYELWAIRNSSTNVKALLLHRMLDRYIDQSFTNRFGVAGSVFLRYGNIALSNPAQRYITKVSQSFVPEVSDPIKYVRLAVSRQQNPVGNLWITIQGDDGTGNADGTIHGTSEYLTANQSSQGGETTFVFDTAVPVSAGGKYHIVAEGDWEYRTSTADSNICYFSGNTAALGPGQQAWMANVGYHKAGYTYSPYANVGFGDCRSYNVESGRWSTSANTAGAFTVVTDIWFKIFMERNDTSLALPSGFNQKCLISYVCTNGASNLKEYHQHERTMSMGFDADWHAYTSLPLGFPGTTQFSVAAVDLGSMVPPVPCGVQFLGYSSEASSGIVLTLRHIFRTIATAAYAPGEGGGGTDDPIDGTYSFGGAHIRTVLSHVTPLDDIQLVNLRNLGTPQTITLYIANITF